MTTLLPNSIGKTFLDYAQAVFFCLCCVSDAVYISQHYLQSGFVTVRLHQVIHRTSMDSTCQCQVTHDG